MQLPHARDLPFVDREGGRTVDEISGKSFSKHWIPMSAFSGEVSATVVTSFPNEIEEIEHTWVPLSDGTAGCPTLEAYRRQYTTCARNSRVHPLLQTRWHGRQR